MNLIVEHNQEFLLNRTTEGHRRRWRDSGHSPIQVCDE
jgi:hypothetical protein